MFCWLDLLIIGAIVWGALSGYTAGAKRAIARLSVLAGAFLVALPFAENCAAHLGPSVKAFFSTRAITAAAGTAPVIWGPWRDVLAVKTIAEKDFPQVLPLAVNLAAAGFLVFVLLLVYSVIEKPKAPVQDRFGLAAGLSLGLAAVVLFLTLAPVLARGRVGGALAVAAEDSVLFSCLSPLIRVLVALIVPFVL